MGNKITFLDFGESEWGTEVEIELPEEKQTFVDPKTGEEIKVTWLAFLVGLMIFNFVISSLVSTSVWIYNSVLDYFILFARESCSGVAAFFTTFGGLIEIDLVFVLACWFPDMLGLKYGSDFVRRYRAIRLIHDGIARTQHNRQQQLLQRKLAEEEWAGVPDRALSRASRSGQPQPTDTSLSQAEKPKEEKPRLAGAVGDQKQPTRLLSFVERFRR